MWSHSKLKSNYYGNYEFTKSGKRVLYLESFSKSGKKVKSYKFTSWQKAKAAGWKHH